MIKKLKSRAGLTLTEMLVTMLILSMFSSACLIGITTAFRARQDNIKANDADILASIVTQLITDELRMSEFETPPTSGEEITYRSHASGYNNVTLCLKNVTDDGNDLGGRLCMTINGTTVTDQMMLNDATYSTFPLCLSDLYFDVNGDVITVKFDVRDGPAGMVLVDDRTFTVKPMNDFTT